MHRKYKHNISVIVMLLVSGALNVIGIPKLGYANQYYASAVHSMGTNLHAFLFNALDSAGFITLDKPPLGFWIQVLFTKILGFNSFALILPQALCAVASVYIVYKMVSKRFDHNTGMIAGLVLAVTPIFVAVSRNNTIDSILIFLLLCAVANGLRAIEQSSVDYLVRAAFFIGLGFNVKMLQALMILPALYITYLIFSKEKPFEKFISIFIASFVLVIVSLLWVGIVDMVPQEKRPYIGGTENNSAIELVVGYNGVQRVLGSEDDGATRPAPPSNSQSTTNPSLNPPSRLNETGNPGIARLFAIQNGGQIGWFVIPGLMVSLSALFLSIKKKFRKERSSPIIVLSAWIFISMFLFFSFARGINHRYYYAMLAPYTAILTAIFLYQLEEDRRIYIPIAFLVIGGMQLLIQYQNMPWMQWILLGYAAALIIVFFIQLSMVRGNLAKNMMPYFALLLALPILWSSTPIIYGDNTQLPIAGPALQQQIDHFDQQPDLSGVADYLSKNVQDEEYWAVVPSAMDMGSDFILQTQQPIMVLGGFNGQDTPLELTEFIQMAQDGQVRYAYIPIEPRLYGSNQRIFQWIRANGQLVSPSLYDGIPGWLLYDMK